MGAVYATVSDLETLGRPLTAPEQQRAPELLEIASALLRQEAARRRYDLDAMISENADNGLIAKSVTVRAVIRGLDTSTSSGAAISQESQSGLGYSAQWTYVNAGQSLYFLRNELKELGILRQRYGVLEVYDYGSDA